MAESLIFSNQFYPGFNGIKVFNIYDANNSTLMKNIVVFVIAFASLGNTSVAQDVRFSQFYANPIYLNPSLAGMASEIRTILVHRQQGNSINGFTTSAFSIDGTLGTSSGYGLQIIKDVQLNNVINSIRIASVVGHRIHISKTAEIGMGLRVGYFQHVLDFGKLIFEDQLDQRYGVTNSTYEQLEMTSISGVDVSLGMIYATKDFYAGATVSHLNKPANNFGATGTSKLPIRYTIHAGGFLRTNNFRKNEFKLSPNIIFEQQGRFNYLHLGVYFGSEVWTFGAWYRVNDSVVSSLGLNLNKFRFGYSYDLPVTEAAPTLNSAHELTAAYSFKLSKKRKIKNRYKGKCLPFQKYLF